MAKTESVKTESKAYNPAAVAERIWKFWEDGNFFRAEPDARPPEKRFSIVIPPPNVTGALHLGHALNNTLQDILVRQKRMAGFNTLWVVGTDHAGIATQATVEKTIRRDENLTRHQLGREKLVERIWEWKEKYGSRIVEQLKLMGCSCDYSRERFTLDEGCAKAVRETFFKLFRDGLIFRGKRLVNWDTQLQTAVADDEVYHEAVKGHFYHFKYPLVAASDGATKRRSDEGNAGEPLVRESLLAPTAGGIPSHVHIATTRPETMLADTAVAVHPDPAGEMDKREKELREKLADASAKDRPDIEKTLADLAERRTTHLPTLIQLRDLAKAGCKIMLPLMNREIPLICDEWADPTLGTGCVKITPAHDANDHEVFKRHPEIGIINVMTPDGRVTDEGGIYKGLKFEEARKKVVADLEALGLVEKIEDREIELAHSDRSKTPIEPYYSDQWFVKMGDLTPDESAKVDGLRAKASGLAQMAMNAICHDDSHYGDPASRKDCAKVHIFPRRYSKTYLDWLGEKRDWCISRQLWWGHRIPVWHVHPDHLIPAPGQVKYGGPDYVTLKNRLSCEFVIQGLYPQFGEHLATPENQYYEFAERNLPICLRSEPSVADRALLEQCKYVEDPDVLDTWFSSALWPHSTLGWTGDDGAGECGPPVRMNGVSSQRANSAKEGNAADQRSALPPAGNSLLDYFYPTSVLSTAREIITLWVARMVLTGLYNIGDIPFHDVVIHPVIQDGQGRKMSKTLGNGVDPVDIIDKYGADALRFTLAELATETQDIRMPVKKEKLPDGREINVSDKFEKGRNFCNKIWQASTGFILSRLEGFQPKPLAVDKLPLEDRWILSRLTGCINEMNEALAAYQFSAATQAVYRFFWDDYCNWYIEMAKSRLAGTGPDAGRDSREGGCEKGFTHQQRGEGMPTNPPKADGHGTQSQDDGDVCRQVLVHVLDQALRLLHPITPFVTEAVWAELNTACPKRGLTKLIDGEPALIAAAWPTADASLMDAEIDRRMALIQSIIGDVREIRTTINGYRSKTGQSAVKTLPSATVLVDAGMRDFLSSYHVMICSLGGCDAIDVRADLSKPAGALGRVTGLAPVYAPVTGLVDVAEVCSDLKKQVENLRGALVRAEAQLANADFINRADPTTVDQARQRAKTLAEQITALEQQLRGLE